MKQIILILFATVLLFASYSCKEDNEVPNKKQIIIDKSWKLTAIDTEEANAEFEGILTLSLSYAAIEYDFKSDGSYDVSTNSLFGSETESGTWSISDNYETVTIDGEVGTIVECTESSLKFKYEALPLDFDEDISDLELGSVTLVFTAVN